MLSFDLAAELNLDRPMIVHGDRPWDAEWQRPQHLLTRFARSREVLYIEPPTFVEHQQHATLAQTEPVPRLQHVVPQLPMISRESDTETRSTVRGLVLDLIGRGGRLHGRFGHPVLWFYTPMPAPTMIGAFGEVAVVYDYLNAPTCDVLSRDEIEERTQYLLTHADVVFDHHVSDTPRSVRAHNSVVAMPDGIAEEGASSWERIVDGISVLMHRAIAKRARRRWHEQMHGIRVLESVRL